MATRLRRQSRLRDYSSLSHCLFHDEDEYIVPLNNDCSGTAITGGLVDADCRMMISFADIVNGINMRGWK